jgi:molybdate transport system substrate-binding protein
LLRIHGGDVKLNPPMPKLIAALLCAFAMCSPAAAQVPLVFAAASLKNALDDVAALSPSKPTISYAASSALAKQIENGAPAGIFISADLDWMDYLEQRRLLREGTRRTLLGNRLVLIAPAGSAVKAEIGPGFPLAKLLGDGRLAIADPASVPAGKYAKAALEKFGVWDSVAAKLAPTENVRAALLLVARGEAPLGTVYATDAAVEPKVRIVAAFPDGSHPAIVYPAALTAAAPATGPAADFLALISSPAARKVFEKYGFTPLN